MGTISSMEDGGPPAGLRVGRLALITCSLLWAALTIWVFIIRPSFVRWETNASFVVFFGTLAVLGIAAAVRITRRTELARIHALAMTVLGIVSPAFLWPNSNSEGKAILIVVAVPAVTSLIALMGSREARGAFTRPGTPLTRRQGVRMVMSLLVAGVLLYEVAARAGWVMLAPLGELCVIYAALLGIVTARRQAALRRITRTET